MLADILEQHKIFITFDALDEAAPSARNALLSRLSELPSKNIFALLTARPGIDLRAIVSRAKVVEILAQTSDLELFAQSYLAENDNMQDILEDCEENVLTELTANVLSNARGM